MKPKETAKRMIALLLALIMAALCCACSGGGNTPTDDSEKSQNTQTQRPGGSSTEGQRPGGSSTETQQPDTDSQKKTVRLEKCESTGEVGFDNISISCSAYGGDYYMDLFPFEYKDKWGYINDKGEIVIENKYDAAGVFSEGKAFVSDSDGWYIIDTDGKVLFSTQENMFSGNYKEIAYARTLPYFQNGNATVLRWTHSGKTVYDFAIMNSDFKMKAFSSEQFEDDSYIPAYFPEIINNDAFQGFTVCTVFPSAETIYRIKLYDMNGELVSKCDSLAGNNIYRIGDTFLKMEKDDMYALVDLKTGAKITDYKYDNIGKYSDGVIPVCAYDKWGLIDASGKELIKCQFDYLSEFSNGVGFALDFDGNGMIVNKSGEKIFDLPNEVFNKYHSLDVSPFTKNGFSYVTNVDDKGFLITETGEVIFSGDADEFKYISAGYVVYDDDLYKVVVE